VTIKINLQNMLIAITIIVLFSLITSAVIENKAEERLIEQNRAMLAVATPQATQEQFCAMPTCTAGQLVCPEGQTCPNNCGIICALDITPAVSPGVYLVCWRNQRPSPDYCYYDEINYGTPTP